jgi:hypothetical protein
VSLPAGGEDANGDMSYLLGDEHKRASVNREAPQLLVAGHAALPAREGGLCKLAHRHTVTLRSELGNGVGK